MSANFSPEDLELLIEASRLLSSKLDLNQLLFTIMELATRVMRVEASSVLLLDEETKELYFDVAVGGGGDSLKGVRVPMGKGIAGWVAKEAKPLIVNDVNRDPRWSGDIDTRERSFITKSMIACPLQAKGKVVGVVEAMNRVDGSLFSDLDLKLFEAFASQAAIAIENARLFSNLALEKGKMERIFKEMADGAMLVDGKGRILSMNRQALDWFKDLNVLNIKDFDGKGFLWDPDPSGLLMSPAQSGSLEIRRLKPKLLVLSGTWGRISTEKDQTHLYIFLFRDVTETQREAFLQKNFLSMISHKLRTPLVAITGYMPLLKEEWERLSDTQKKAFEAIDREGRHLNYLVEDLLRFTTISGAFGDIKIAHNKISAARLIDDSLFKASLLVSSLKVQVEKQVDPNLEIFGDTSLLIDMIKSLVENAIQFNNKDAKKLSLSVSRQDGYAVFKIGDNGPGIPAEERDRIFKWFYQIEEDFTGQVKGMGLGLAFVKKVVELHKGKVELESKIGEGSVFSVHIPTGS